MNVLDHKINFAAIILVNGANPNGNPLDGNRPRTDTEGFGEISDVAIKRKLRNRMQDLGREIYVQADDRITDEARTLEQRAANAGLKTEKKPDAFYNKACEKWIDVRTFGQVFPFDGFAVKSLGVRGPATVLTAKSVAPVEVESMQITKSTSGSIKDEGKSRGADTMGMKHFVKHGVYIVKGSISVQLAEKTGFTTEDAETFKECLRTLFVNDESSARPDGTMEVVKVFWWDHNNKDGQYSSAKVYRSLDVHLKDDAVEPTSIDDYEIALNELDGLKCTVIEGI